jgi:hypothetical protein
MLEEAADDLHRSWHTYFMPTLIALLLLLLLLL